MGSPSTPEQHIEALEAELDRKDSTIAELQRVLNRADLVLVEVYNDIEQYLYARGLKKPVDPSTRKL